VKDNRVLAVAGMNRDAELAAAEELMRLDRLPSREQLKWTNVNLLELLHSSHSPKHVELEAMMN
jgi:hypothetical protein